MDDNVETKAEEIIGADEPEKLPGERKALFSKRNIIFIIFVITVSGLIFFVIQFSAKQNKLNLATQIANEAEKAYFEGDIVEAKNKLVEMQEIFPDDPRIQSALIKTIANEGNLTGNEQAAYNLAKPYIDKAIETNSNNADVLVAVGYVNEIAGNYTEALNYYEKALLINGSNADALFHKGHVLEFLNRQEEAFEIYKKAYEINPNNLLIISAMAKVSLFNGDMDKAIDLYIKAGNLSDTSPDFRAEALTNASIIKRGQIIYMADAINLSKQAVNISPNFSPALAAHGFNLGINGRFDEGVDYLKRSTTANPRISQNYYFLGILLRSVGNYEEAIPYLEQAYSKIDNDNTILGTQNKSRIKGNTAYDLAKTYSLAGMTDENIVELLQTAIGLNSALKNSLIQDYESGKHFQNMTSNFEFRNLII